MTGTLHNMRYRSGRLGKDNYLVLLPNIVLSCPGVGLVVVLSMISLEEG